MQTIKFTQQIKDQWLEALKSGKYPKGIGYLKTDDGSYCCLGVLAEGVLVNYIEGLYIDVSKDECALGSTYDVCKTGEENVGYQIFNNMLGEELTDKLINVNDSAYTFEEVISIIENAYVVH